MIEIGDEGILLGVEIDNKKLVSHLNYESELYKMLVLLAVLNQLYIVVVTN